MDTSELDEKYLREFASSNSLKLPKDLRDYQIKYVTEEIDKLIYEGHLPEDLRDKMIKMRFDEIHGTSFRPDTLIKIQKYALDAIGKNEYNLEKIPVGMISSLDTNAYTLKTPFGGKAIALSHSLWMHMRNIFYCFEAIAMRDSISGIGKHHSNETYVNNIYTMIDAINNNSILMFVIDEEHSLLDVLGPSSKPELSVVLSLENALTFILLHEYGHIVLGHLNDDQMIKYNILDKNIDTFDIQHLDEYRADEYAAIKMWGTDELSFADNLNTALSTFKFFFMLDLCELLKEETKDNSHPPALKRFDNILEIFRINTNNKEQWDKIYHAVIYYGSVYTEIYKSILDIKNRLTPSQGE